MRLSLLVPAALLVVAAVLPPSTGSAHEDGPPLVGLSLWFQDGQVRNQDLSPKTTLIVDGYTRYVQEMDVTASVTTSTDQGIDPVVHQSDLSVVPIL